MKNEVNCANKMATKTHLMMKNLSLKLLFALCAVLFTAANAWAGSAYSRGRAWLKGDSPTGSGQVYVSQSSTDNGTYKTCNTTESEISSSEKEGENTTTKYYFYAKANDGYKFTGWYSKNADGTYTLQTSNTTHSASVKSGSAPKVGSSYTDLDRYAGFVKVVNYSFIQPVNGSFTIKNNGTAVANYASFEVAGAVNLKATPASGYKFAGWYTTTDGGATKNYFSFAAEVQPSFEDNVTIGADFIQSNGQAIFWVRDAQMYDNLSSAITAAASSSSKQIIVVGDGTVAAGNYTIPNGVTLLVPYDADYTLKTTDPGHAYSAPTAPKVYKKLTLVTGVNITVEGGGAISVSATSQGGQPYGGCVHGNYGQIDLQSGSTITMQSGSNLYCWGYITGAGEITAQSGSKVYEDFQIACWRGGSAASSMNNNSKKVFPLAQYYIQNIEAKLHLMAGASEYVWTSVSANNDAQRPSSAIQIIGSSSGLFQLSSGMLTKWYNATDDRQMYELEGNMALGSISMTIYVTINSTNYVLPLTNNMDIKVKSGTMTCDQKIAVLPGAKISVEAGANVSFGAGSEIYVYDKDEWGVYNYYTNVIKGAGYLCEANYSPTCSNIHGKRLYSNMTDALIDVNGTFTTASGHLYTTSGKADIYSSNGTGKIVYSKVAQSNTETYQATQSGSSISYTSIPITPAQLHNADGSYLATAGAPAGTTIQYANGHWGWKVTWKDDDETVIKTEYCYTTPSDSWISSNKPANPTQSCKTFSSWSQTSNDATNQERVYKATYTTHTYAISYNAGANGSGTVAGGTKTCGVNFTLSTEKFTRTGYTQTGWSTTDGGAKAYDMGATYSIDAAQTFYPFWTANTHKFAWDFAGGSTSSSSHTAANNALAYGTTITYPANNTMSKDGYTFTGWSTSVTSMPDNDLTIVAQWQLNNFTITYDKGAYGAGSIADGTKTPGVNFTLSSEKFTRTGYTQTGWSTEDGGAKVYDLGGVYTDDANITLYPFWTSVPEYTITWKVDGQVDETTQVAQGTNPVYPHGTPAKAMVDQYTYTFEGWSNGTTTYGKDATLPAVTGPVTYTAQFQDHVRYYTITWKNWDGTVLETDGEEQGMQYGAAISYDGATPSRDGDGRREYTFTGWSPEVTSSTKVNGDQDYIAQYSMSIDIDEKDDELVITGNETATATTVRVEGRLNLSSGSLTTNTLILEASLDGSGQILGGDNLTVNGDAYFDLSNGTDGFLAKTWYAVAVPWQVAVPTDGQSGIFIKKNNKLTRQTIEGTCYVIRYDGAWRATDGVNKAWKYLSDISETTMQPGVLYMIYLNSDADAIRFQRAEDAPLQTTSFGVSQYKSGEALDAGWNGIANPSLFKAYLESSKMKTNPLDNTSADKKYAQKYVPIADGYDVIDMSANPLPVGQPVFVQVSESGTVVAYDNKSQAGFVAAPRRAMRPEDAAYEVQISAGQDYTDRLFLQVMDGKEDRYQIGLDLAKASTSSKVAQMWVNRYDAHLCVNTTAPVGSSVTYPLGIYAPKEGDYQISSVTPMQSGQELFVTLNGRAIWNLAYGPYTATLSAGTHTEYGLKLIQGVPAVETGIDQTQSADGQPSVRKVLIDNQVYIIRGGEVYSVTGQKSK